MKFGVMFQLQTPRPIDADQWHEHDELKIYHEALEQIELADQLGYDYVFITEHHFLEEYCHSSAPEVFLAAAAARTKAGAWHRPDAAEAEPPRPCGGAHRRP
jgi:Luciferase-like monooxygenase